MTTLLESPKPFVVPEYCKGCGRCIGSCIRGCLTLGTDVDPVTGLIPIVLDLTDCNGCGPCFDACPELFSLLRQGEESAPRGRPVAAAAAGYRCGSRNLWNWCHASSS